MTKLYEFMRINILWLNDKTVINKIKDLIRNDKTILETNNFVKENICKFIKKQKKRDLIYSEYQTLSHLIDNSQEYSKKLLLKIENAKIIKECLINIENEMNLTEIISTICVKKFLPNYSISKHIFSFVKEIHDYDL